MGGVVMRLNYHCGIHDSTFKDECSDNDAAEQKALDIGRIHQKTLKVF